MGIAVYANGMSIACKAASGKSAAAMPDVCLSPPSPPAGPVPIPYPNTAMASDTDQGSKTVMINGEEVMLKDKSVFKTSTGNEAATKSLGMGVVTHQIQGTASFLAWSMDVKFEGENIPRHLDIMGHNEASDPTDTPPWPYLDGVSLPPPPPPEFCDEVKERYPVETYGEQKSKTGGVYDGKQSHHVIQNAHFQQPRGTTINQICPGYSEDAAPCIPLEDGTDVTTAHGRISQMQKADAKRYRDRIKNGGKNPTYPEARQDAKNQLIAQPKPGLSDNEAECVLIEVDKQFRKICSGAKSNQLRAPGQRSKWKPDVAVSGGGAGGPA